MRVNPTPGRCKPKPRQSHKNCRHARMLRAGLLHLGDNGVGCPYVPKYDFEQQDLRLVSRQSAMKRYHFKEDEGGSLG
ncbi:hypothetical protein FHS81_002306 [Pseudochelatococcus contaminans]|uniref:Uncharacterized protein n=1 Tax=Pseudochelatococcus contaminans TaxID=1538103 RepID=A0A7W5Z5H3_9HYPH|nr:hypothetical protein [Pseudochelatococcus contaminans]